MKIPKMSKTEIKQWIRACKKLLKHYKKELSQIDHCPLCKIAEKWHKDTTCCCPWIWFTKTDCDTTMDKYDEDPESVMFHFKPSFFKLRLRQLPKWIKKLEALL